MGNSFGSIAAAAVPPVQYDQIQPYYEPLLDYVDDQEQHEVVMKRVHERIKVVMTVAELKEIVAIAGKRGDDAGRLVVERFIEERSNSARSNMQRSLKPIAEEEVLS